MIVFSQNLSPNCTMQTVSHQKRGFGAVNLAQVKFGSVGISEFEKDVMS